MDRRKLISGIGSIAAWNALTGKTTLFAQTRTQAAGTAATPAEGTTLRPFTVQLPSAVAPLPFVTKGQDTQARFKMRGIKGYAWSPEQYLAQIPLMAKYGMNFLMNCYSSFWDLGPHGAWVHDRPMNFWYRPLPDEKRRKFEDVIRACQKNGITFCLSTNPNLMSDRPFDYAEPKDLEALWQHYAWAQKLGVKWFNISLDDIARNISADGHASLVNTMLQRLRSRDPEAQLTFCPTWYAGTGEAEVETSHILGKRTRVPRPGQPETPGMKYTRRFAELLHPDVYLFWTGPVVESPTISVAQAARYKALVKHRLILWDNYPVNDQMPALDLGPLRGRDPELYTVIDGYMSNSMGYENEANRVPMLTIADYISNPKGYDPDRSIGQSIMHLGKSKAEREALRNMVELYPGRLWDGTSRAQWNSLRALFDQYLAQGKRKDAEVLLRKAQTTLAQVQPLFPDAWSSGSRILEMDVKQMQEQLAKQQK